MCGLAGLWDRAQPTQRLRAIASEMTDVLRPRGPDGHDLWLEPRGGLALGHRRLSILDLSEQGKQPMVSESGRYVLTYNGEVYNCDELRNDLGRSSESFRGHSDTEVMLASIEHFGLENAVSRFNGMFAFALWDREEEELALVRDRLGIKPLFFGRAGDALVFGSQASSLARHPQFEAAVSPEALAAYFRGSCVPAPLCIYRDAHKVMPGTIARFSSQSADPSVSRYWDPLAVAGRPRPLVVPPALEAVEALDRLLTDAVERRMISDVPLGAFLSGGIDSSTVVALMTKVSASPVQTFTIGTNEASHDESGDARAIATHLGTEHHELIATPSDVVSVAETISEAYDEPFADSSQIPTFLVSRLARQHVTVALSGDGGDELFGGYNRHLWGPRVGRLNARIPTQVRRLFARRLESLRPETLEWIYRVLIPKVGPLDMRFPANKAVKLARAVSASSDAAMYEILANQNADPAQLLYSPAQEPNAAFELPEIGDLAHRFMYRDMTGYLPNDILTKVDRASMAVSLEARVPLLDHRVVEMAWGLPLGLKQVGGQGKWILRQVLGNYVPASLVDRPKSGFGIPVGAWLRGPLREWASELLAHGARRSSDLIRDEAVQKIWGEHLSGKRDWHQELWSILMFHDWRRNQEGGPASSSFKSAS